MKLGVRKDAKEFEEAIKKYDEIIEQKEKDSTLKHKKALVLYYSERYDEAKDAFDSVLELDPEHISALNNKALTLEKLGNVQESLDIFDEILEINPCYHSALNNKGGVLRRLGKYDEAIKCFEKVLSDDPENYYSWNEKGITLFELRKYDEAIEAFDRSMEYDKKESYGITLNYKGLSQLYIKKTEDALNTFDDAIENFPSYDCPHFNKALVYQKQGNDRAFDNTFRIAVGKFDELLKDDPEWADLLNAKGYALRKLRRYREAKEVLDQATKIDPDHAEAWNNKGLTISKIRKYPRKFEEALQAFENATKIKDNYTEAWINKGLILKKYEKYGKVEKYKENFEKALEICDENLKINEKNTDSWYQKGLISYDLENYEDAVKAFDKAIEIDPEDTYALCNKGVASRELERYYDSLLSFDKIIKRDPTDQAAWNQKGLTFIDFGKTEEALEAFEKSISMNKSIEDWEVTSNGLIKFELRNLKGEKKAVSPTKRKEYERDLKAFEKALKIDEGNAEIWNNKGRTLHKLLRYEEALEAFEKSLEIDKENAEIWNNKGLVLRKLLRYEEALEAFEKATKNDYPEALVNKGLILLKLNEQVEDTKQTNSFDENLNYKKDGNKIPEALKAFEEAINIYDQVLKSGPSKDADFNKGLILSYKGFTHFDSSKKGEAKKDFENAIHSFENSLTNNKSNEETTRKDSCTHNNMGVVFVYKAFLESNKKQKACEYLEKAIKQFDQAINAYGLKPENLYAFHNKGFALCIQKKYDEAEKIFEKCREIEVVETKAWNNRVNALSKLGRYSEALKACKKAILMNPMSPGPRNNKGIVHYELGNYDKAMEAFEEAIQLDKDHAHAWNNKGIMLSKLEKEKEAIDAFNKAIEVDPSYYPAWNNKGLLLCELGKLKEAQETFENATKVYPDNLLAHSCLGKLHLCFGNLEDSNKEIDAAFNIDKFDRFAQSQAWCANGQIEVEKSEYKSAVSSFKKAMDLDPVNPHFSLWYSYARYLQASFLFLSGEKEKKRYEEEILSIIRDLEKMSELYEKGSKIPNMFVNNAYLKILDIINKLLAKSGRYLEDFCSIFSSSTSGKCAKVSELLFRKLNHTKLLSLKNERKSVKEARKVKGYILYFLGCYYYKIDDVFSAKDKLEECVKLKSKAPFERSAKKLLSNIWEYKIQPSWLSWWIKSPENSWTKRIIFLVISSIILTLGYGMASYIIDKEEIPTYALLVFIIFSITLLSPSIKYAKGGGFEVEVKHSPPPVIEFHPFMPSTEFEKSSPVREIKKDLKRCVEPKIMKD